MSEEQQVNIKQRIIGALVLVSLGIIIIPLLLNGGATSTQSISGDNIPEMPKKMSSVLPKVPRPMVMPAAKTIKAYPERSPVLSSKTTKTKTKQKAVPTAVKNKPIQSKPVTQIVYKKAPKPTTSKINTAYTLQIASFAKKSNADALQTKLRKKKYKAYIESTLTSKGKIYRLRVGPYLKFDQISKIKKKIEKQYKLKKTVIIKYK